MSAPNRIQLLFSPRPVRTSSAISPSVLGVSGSVLYEWQTDDTGRRIAKETHYWASETVKKGLSGPPLHVHLNQEETFHVLQGALGVEQEGKHSVLTPESGPVTFPAGKRHRFYPHSSSGQDVVFHVWPTPSPLSLPSGRHGFDESFLRNFASYLNDCEAQHISPSIFQLVLFLYDADIVLSPPFWVPLCALSAVSWVVAYPVASWLLGYRASYPEYADAPGDNLLAKKAI